MSGRVVAAGDKKRFVLVGASAFVIGSALIEGQVAAGVSPYAAQLPAFLIGATWTWWLNRRFTFAIATPPSRTEYGRYLLSSAGGIGISMAVYTVFVALGLVPVAALAGGTLAGLLLNYLGYSRFAFASRQAAAASAPQDRHEM